MPLSKSAQKSLSDSARISNERKAGRRAEINRQESERQNAEDEYNNYFKQQAEIQTQIDALEEQDRVELEKQQAVVTSRDELKQVYSDKIDGLIAGRQDALNSISKTSKVKIVTGSGGGFPQHDETDVVTWVDRPKGGSEIQFEQDAIYSNYKSAIDRQAKLSGVALSSYDFAIKYPGVLVQGSVRDAFNDPSNKKSLIELHEQQQNRLEQKKLSQRQSAINQSAGQLGASRAEYAKLASEYGQKRTQNDLSQQGKIIFNSTPTKAGDLKEKAIPPARELFQAKPESIPINLTALKSYQATQKAKAEKLQEYNRAHEKIMPDVPAYTPQTKSNAFLTKAPVYGSSIIGTTFARSDLALFTFEETQKQQKELSDKVRNAKSAEEATKIKEEYQKINPYVGTPQTARTKQGTAKQGVLIDLKLNIAKEDEILETTAPAPQQNKIMPDVATVTTFNVKFGDRTITGIKDEATANKIIERLNRNASATEIPQYNFVKDGKEYKPTAQELFKYNDYLLNRTPSLPSLADNEFNKILRDDPNAFSFDPDLQSGKAKEVNLENAYAVANKDPVNRGILNTVVNPDETVLGKSIGDVAAVGVSVVKNKPLPTESKVVTFVDTKQKTDEGRKELIGEVIGEYFLARAFSGAPSLAIKLYGKAITSPKTLKIAEGIASSIRKSGRDPATEKMISRFPDMPESMKTQLRSTTNKEIVGIEMIDSRTALIKRGTELNEVQTPYILVKNTGKTAHAKLYETYTTDRPGAYSKIVISGEQRGELSGGVRVGGTKIDNSYNEILSKKNPNRKQDPKTKKLLKKFKEKDQNPRSESKPIVEYKATRDNIIKVQDVSKLATVGTSEKVGIQGLRETPMAVIEKIETQEVKSGSIIMETQRLNKIKSMNQDVKGLNRFDDFTPSTTKTKPATATIRNKIDVGIPTSKRSNITILKGKTPTTQKRETLENIIKNTQKESINLKTNSLNKLSSISVITSTQATRSIQGTGATQRTEGATAQTTQTQQAQKTEISTGLESASKLRTDTISRLKNDLDTVQKRKPSIDPKYSLITKPGLDDKQSTLPALVTKQGQTFEFVLKEKPVIRVPVPTKTTTSTIRPGFPISLDLGDNKTNSKPRKQRKGISFYRYNVNTESVGRYIEEAPDISTGKTRKVIDRVDSLQSRINTPGYAKKQTRREERRYKKEMTVQKKQSGSFESRMYIPNITAPKGKKAQKQLKKLGFKLDIF